jgi:(R,R)-butanediol dehydrogenase/meso-butanediol dehydrogenase/diacetyl reductase
VKAAVFKAPGQPLSIEALADPVPGPDQVVLQVGRCGICGSDLHMTEGPNSILPPGAVLGHEFAGEVVARGAAVDHLKLGDRVTALPMSGCGHCATCLEGKPQWCSSFQWTAGGYAEYVLAEARSCLKLPSSLSLADGALVEPMAVALHAVRLADFSPGANVLVIGAGPIGLAVVYWARRMKAGSIAVTAGSARRAELAGTMGADHFLVNDSEAPASLNRKFGGLPDVVIECVGLPGMIARATQLVRPRGSVVIAGCCMGSDQFVPMVAMLKELRMQFSLMYGVEDFRRGIDALDAGRVEVRAMITDTVALPDFPEAFETLRARTQQCKVMLAPWG